MLYLCRYGELWLKSEPVRKRFAKLLSENLKKQFEFNKITDFKIIQTRERLFIESPEEISRILSKIFGLTSFSKVEKCAIEELGEKTIQLAKKFNKKDTFAIRVKRQGNHSFSSKEMEKKLGALVVEKFGNRVNLSNPGKTIFAEIRENDCYIFSKNVPAGGGLPVGSEGSVAVEFDETKKSAVASYLMMKRGCYVFLVGKGNCKNLLVYDSNIKVYKNFSEIPENGKIKAIVSSEKENFVASKRFNSSELPVFYPLVGLSKEKIEELYNKI